LFANFDEKFADKFPDKFAVIDQNREKTGKFLAVGKGTAGCIPTPFSHESDVLLPEP